MSVFTVAGDREVEVLRLNLVTNEVKIKTSAGEIMTIDLRFVESDGGTPELRERALRNEGVYEHKFNGRVE